MRTFLFCLLISSSIFAQKKDLSINFVFPLPGDTLAVKKVRLAANVSDSLATVTVNDSPVTVYQTGAFVDMLRLKPGTNHFFIRASHGIEVTRDTLTLFRKPPLESLPETPTAFSTEKVLPNSNVTFYAPSQLVVQFMGSPGGDASFEIDDLVDDELPMVELSANETGGLSGIYRGVYDIQPGDRCENEEIVFHLRGKDGDHETFDSGKLISVIQTGQPKVVQTTSENTLVYYRPDSEILLETGPGIDFKLIAENTKGFFVEIAPGLTGYIAASRAEKRRKGLPPAHAALRSINAKTDSSWLTFSFSLSSRIPFKLEQRLDPQRVRLRLFRAHFQNEWSVYPELSATDSLPFFDHFDWTQVNDSELDFEFYFNTAQQWGFKGWFEGKQLKIAFRVPPLITSDSLFKNLRIVLDPGHGGKHKGAVGASGLMEKSINLRYTKYLAEFLRSAGAKVMVTRTADSTMFLSERMKRARQFGAHLFIWLHNNSTGISSDPLEAAGTSTYYRHDQGLSFSRTLYPHLLKLGLAPKGLIHRSYYMTRQTDMVVYLVEGAFLSHPGDEIFLSADENLKQLAQAVFNGLRDRLMNISVKSPNQKVK